MIIRLCRIQQRSHSITSGTLMSPDRLLFSAPLCRLLQPPRRERARAGWHTLHFHIGVRRACIYTKILHGRGKSRGPLLAKRRYRRGREYQRPPPSKSHVDEARNCGLHSTALLAVRRFNWRSPMKHSSTSKMNYHRDTHVFTDDKDIYST